MENSPPPEKETPKQFLQRLIGKKIRIILKWGLYYEGTLCGTDKYFNVLIDNCKEIDGDTTNEIGETLIRCNNIKIIIELKA